MLLGQVEWLQRFQPLMNDRFTFYAVVAILVLIVIISFIQVLRKRARTAKPPVQKVKERPVAAPKPVVTPVYKTAHNPVPVAAVVAPEEFQLPKYDFTASASNAGNQTVGGGDLYNIYRNTRTSYMTDEMDLTAYPTTDRNSLIFGPITEPLASLLPEGEEQKKEITKELKHAGYYSPFSWHNLAAIRYLGIMLPILVCGALLVVVPPAAEFYVIIAMIVLPILGWSMPRLIVRGKAQDRLAKIENGMPDMIDMLNMCVSQGLSLLPSLKKVSTELTDVHPELSSELKIVTRQAEVGNIHHALDNFAHRVESPEVHSFTSLLLQTEQMGTSVSEALMTYSDSMRESLKQRADHRANTASFKLLFPTVLCFMPAVFLFLMGPAIVEMSEFMYGKGRQSLNQNTNEAISILNRNAPRN
jgi:tight adherence protein C